MRSVLRKVLSLMLCSALLLSVMRPALAVESAPETGLSEAIPAEETVCPETAGATEPAETAAETGSPTAPEEAAAETAPPTAPEEVAAETASPTAPEENAAETGSPTAPEETAAETVSPTVPEETAAETTSPTLPEETVPGEAAPSLQGWNLYFGQLHSHTNLSDGLGSVTEAFEHAAQVENLDFFAVTDHSNSFDHDELGVISEDAAAFCTAWETGRAAAAAVSDEDFLGIFGYEMTWQEERHLGHINTFGTPGFASRHQEEFASSLEAYYRALTTVPGSVSQFNHPGPQYGDFEDFGHFSADYDEQICLLEVGGEGNFTAYDLYTRALDRGWHVAPTTSQDNHNGSWGDARPDRTVVLAKELTEKGLLAAMKARRVYATADGDLQVYYQLDGHVMGSIIGDSDAPEIRATLLDPTDETIGLVEVIADQGRTVAAARVEENRAELTLRPGGGYSYYYLRITQPDGDIAVTAPVWTDSYESLGIAKFAADTQAPTQGRELQLSLELYNDESIDCRIDKIEFFVDGTLIHTLEAPGILTPRAYEVFTIPYTHPGLGNAALQVRVTARAAGQPRTWEESLALRFLPEILVSGILVDGSHGSRPSLEHLKTLAGQANMELRIFEGPMPQGGDILLIPAPELPFEDEFRANVREFAKGGGTVILCGRADSRDGRIHATRELNTLLQDLGSTMVFRDDTAVDEVNQGEAPDRLYTDLINRESPWCQGVTSAQYHAHLSGCTVDPGAGTWLVRGYDTAESIDSDGDGHGDGRVLLACEGTVWGGTLFAAGSLFPDDEAMPIPDSPWAAPRIGQSILEQLLKLEQPLLPLNTIQDLRRGEPGRVYRVRGYVTAGTSNPYNSFPDTIYLQDDTGGIAVVPFHDGGIQVGTPMDVTGYLSEENGMPVLQWMDYDLPEESFRRYVPKTSRCITAMDYGANGGRLMQVSGTVNSVTLTEDGEGVARLTLRDYTADEAAIIIEDGIFSGASGRNRLAEKIRKGRIVRAMGIVHRDEEGRTVLRVRNCDEVVYVPPRRFYPGSNPRTGDSIGIAAAVVSLSVMGLGVVRRKRTDRGHKG